MRENEFEKKVQQRMDDFRLRPSEAVWGKVAGELNRKKKRRTIFFIFLLSGFGLLGYSGYYFFNHSKQNIVERNSTLNSNKYSQSGKAQQKKPGKTTINNSTPADPGSINDAQVEAGPQSNSRTIGLPEEQAANGTGTGEAGKEIPFQEIVKQKNERGVSLSTTTLSKKSLKHPLKSTVPVTVKDEKATATVDRDVQDYKNYPTSQATVDDYKDITKMNKTETIPGPVIPSPAQKRSDSTAKSTASLELEVDSSLLAIENPKQEAGKFSKLKWGIDFSLGVSDSRKSALPFSNNQNTLDSYNNAAAPAFPGSAGYFPIQPPSPVEAGIAFKVGPVAQMQLSKRSRISVGLQYAYMTSRMKTGTYTATTVVVNNALSQSLRLSAVYQGTYRKDFTNKFHFVHVPLTYHLQLNKGKKLPVDWNIGASAGYLVATNGLLYDSAAGGIYYHDKDAYNKFQFNLHTGFAFRFGNNSNIQWSVGPELSMAMNKLANDPYSKKQYLMYGGVTGRLIFSKKNK